MKYQWVTLLILSSVLLQSCLPAVFVAGAAAGGAVIYDNRRTDTMVFDREITFRAQSKLDGDRGLKQKAHLSVATFNRVVLLVGQVPTTELRAQAESLVKLVPNIKVLHNEISVGPLTSDGVRVNDVWLTTKIKTVLLATPDLRSTDLKIVTEDGVVYLMGLTTRAQAELATDKVRAIDGVKKVVRLFEYLS